ncbi:hypothetical protein [Thermoflexibacter ruber]|uniref:T9SS C-terminal target domain-containing protein n=1 Tax=Thermoflexibacter ruber TaxID=1003 RepID=A0A1I2FMI1_9BACT|nr:hypothetical protein [Thermoflexibacter ruber]SFF05988.1 hypothetical protein SAMN04488541_101458 [Thermoflexibacter ruber]
MKHLSKILLLLVLAVATLSCKKESKEEPSGPTDAQGRVIISGNITANRTLFAREKYILQGFVNVKAGATLTIEPGTIIFGDKQTTGTLIVERGGRIEANGSVDRPIVFTSAQPKGQRNYGDWGGIVILGDAPTNKPTDTQVEGVPFPYGGTNANSNSGTLRYVRIEFSGVAITPNNEINGLTLGGVGAGTKIEYIQVSYCGDDSYEWFGGNVDAKYLIAFRGWDDDFDCDFGFSGKVQYGVSFRDPVINDQSASNGFEVDNDAQGTTATPLTSATFSNITIVGPYGRPGVTAFGNDAQWGRAMHLRRNSAMTIVNSLFMGFKEGLRLDGTTTLANYTANTGQLNNNIVAGMTVGAVTGAGGVTTPQATEYWNRQGGNNSILADYSTLGLNTNIFNLTAPNFLPSAGSPLLSGAAFPGKAADAFFDKVQFRGAFGSANWAQGWTNFDPQNADY